MSNNLNVIFVYGDTLDSCVYSRALSNKFPNKKIIHFSSGQFGGIYSNKNGMLGLLSEARKNYILSLIDYDFIPVTESYVKIPYNKLRIKNTMDGNIRFPFTKKSFEFEYDYDDVVLSTPDYATYMEIYSINKNLVKTMKTIFIESFYMDVSKKIGTNIYDTIQSQIDPKFLYKSLFNLESLGMDDYFIYNYPSGGFDDLCTKLLDNKNIEVVIDTRLNIKKTINYKNKSYLFDYYDYYLDFMFGGIDYTKFVPILHKKTLYNIDQISRIYTPYDKKYGIYFQKDDEIFAVDNKHYQITSNNYDACVPTPTQQNYKKIMQYVEISNNIPNLNIVF